MSSVKDPANFMTPSSDKLLAARFPTIRTQNISQTGCKTR